MADQGNPDLLRVARQLRGLQQGDAAQLLGISQAMLSRLENRLSVFTEEVVARAAKAFDLPRTFFIQTDSVLGAPVSVHPMWRKKAAVTAREMEQIVAKLDSGAEAKAAADEAAAAVIAAQAPLAQALADAQVLSGFPGTEGRAGGRAGQRQGSRRRRAAPEDSAGSVLAAPGVLRRKGARAS